MPLPKENRFSLRLHKADFSTGQKIYSQHFTLIRSTVHEPRSTQPSFAILVSKKTAKKATERNKIRRLTSTAIQNHIYQFQPGRYLFVPKGSVLTTPFSELLLDFSTLLLKIK